MTEIRVNMFNFPDQSRTKLCTHVSVDFGQISVMKSDYDFESVNEAFEYKYVMERQY